MMNKIKIMTCTFVIFISWFMVVATIGTSENNQIEDGIETTTHESETVEETEETIDQDVAIPSATVPLETIPPTTETNTEPVAFSRGFTEEEKWLLAKIAMAEAEGESLDIKILVILTVLNRVESNEFPNTIEGVIFEKTGNTYQFSPMIPGGRWWTTEPTEECWEAVSIVNETEYDFSQGALYFESCKGESWHSRNLELICQIGNIRFYK